MVRRLQRQLEDSFHDAGRGEVFAAPADVILTPHDVVEPDLLVVMDARQLSRRGVEGPPTLAVGILSPSTRDRDQTLKARQYAGRRRIFMTADVLSIRAVELRVAVFLYGHDDWFDGPRATCYDSVMN